MTFEEQFEKWYDQNYDEWAEGEDGIALKEELEQAYLAGAKEVNAELKVEIENLKYKEENYLQKIEHKDEVIKTLQNRIEKMKCCYNCSKWNDGECSESPIIYTMADFECETWELKEEE